MAQFVWEFSVRADEIREFEQSYSSAGPWAELTLLRDTENERRFLMIDCWSAAFASFSGAGSEGSKKEGPKFLRRFLRTSP